MSGMCSTGHPWLDGVPTCTCDQPSTDVPGYVRFAVEPLPTTAAKTVITADPATSARVPAARVAAVDEAPILSDDGWWQWDGAAWVPADTPPTAAETTTPGPASAGLAYAEPAAVETAAPETAAPETAAPDETATPDWATWSTPVTASTSTTAASPAAPAPAPVTTSYAAPLAAPLAVPPVPGPPHADAVLPTPPGWQTPPGYGPPPAGYGPPGAYGPPPPWAEGERTRDGRAVAALVCSLIPIVVTQLAAVVLAIVTLVSVERTGRKGQVMSICAIVVSVPMFLVSVAIAIPVFLNQRTRDDDANARIGLRNTANLEETYFTEYGRYAQATQLPPADGVVPTGIAIEVLTDGRTSYCLAGGPAGGSRWFLYDSSEGGLETTVFRSSTAALAACVGSSPTGGAGEGGGTTAGGAAT